MTIAEACDHFIQRELASDNLWRSYSTKRAYKAYIRRWIAPHWGSIRLSEVRTMEVESWLRRLPLAKSSCAKIRNILSVLFNHACRHELFNRNPIRLVRQGAKRRATPSLLTPPEIKALIDNLGLRERTLVLVVASTGLRQSELFGLKWEDINFAQWFHPQNGLPHGGTREMERSLAATSNPTTGFLRADDIVVGNQSGARQFCGSIFALSHSASEFRSDSDGIPFGTRTQLCCEVSEQNSK